MRASPLLRLLAARAIAPLALALGLWARPAAAAEYGAPTVNEGIRLETGTPRYKLLARAAYTNAALFGAVQAVDLYVRPLILGLRSGAIERDFFYRLAFDQSSGSVAQVLGRCPEDEERAGCKGGGVRLFDLAASSSRGAFFAGSRTFGGFVAWSYNSAFVGSHPAYALANIGYGVAAAGPRLAGKSAFASILPGSADTVLGLYVNAPVATIQAGYVASRGAYGEVNVPATYAFLGATLADARDVVGFLRGGFRRFDWLGSADLTKLVGSPSLFAQRLVLGEAAKDTPAALREGLSDTRVALTTVHPGLEAIAQHLDLSAALAVSPTVFLNEIRAKFSSLAAGGDRAAMRKAGGVATLSVGMVKLPRSYAVGYDGRARLSVEATMGFLLQGTGTPGIHGFIRMNPPELLMAFPTAGAADFGRNLFILGFGFDFETQ